MVPQVENSSIYETGATGGVPAVERALDVLELLETSDSRLSLTEIARRLSLPKGSAHRLLTALKSRGYIEQRGGIDGRGGYGLGVRLVALAARSQGSWDVVRAALEPMRRLAQATGEGCQLSVRSGGRALCIARVPSPSHPEVALMGGIGSSFPLHAVAVGKALIAFAPEFERADYLAAGDGPLAAFTPQTIVAPGTLAAELESIRKDGIARDREEYKRGLRAIAAPIFDAEGTDAVAAIAVPLLAGGQGGGMEEAKIENAVRAAALEASRALGYRGGTE